MNDLNNLLDDNISGKESSSHSLSESEDSQKLQMQNMLALKNALREEEERKEAEMTEDGYLT